MARGNFALTRSGLVWRKSGSCPARHSGPTKLSYRFVGNPSRRGARLTPQVTTIFSRRAFIAIRSTLTAPITAARHVTKWVGTAGTSGYRDLNHGKGDALSLPWARPISLRKPGATDRTLERMRKDSLHSNSISPTHSSVTRVVSVAARSCFGWRIRCAITINRLESNGVGIAARAGFGRRFLWNHAWKIISSALKSRLTSRNRRCGSRSLFPAERTFLSRLPVLPERNLLNA